MLCYFQNEVMKKLPSVFGDLLPLLIAHSEVASCCAVSFPMEDPCGREQEGSLQATASEELGQSDQQTMRN